jgi:hypothetical protein
MHSAISARKAIVTVWLNALGAPLRHGAVPADVARRDGRARLGQLRRHHLVTGDAYIDHPSFGMAIIGRLLEAQGFRVGIIAQPDWPAPSRSRRWASPNLFFGVTAGNMDSMVNRYTADRRHPAQRQLYAGRRGRQAARTAR